MEFGFILFELLADGEAVEKLIHAHLAGPNVQTAMFDMLVNRVDLPVNLHLSIFVIGVKYTSTGHNRGGQDQGEKDGGVRAGFFSATVHGMGAKSRATRSFALRARGFRVVSSAVGVIAFLARSSNW